MRRPLITAGAGRVTGLTGEIGCALVEALWAVLQAGALPKDWAGEELETSWEAGETVAGLF